MKKSNIKTIACVIGTRPEVIKMAPIIGALKEISCFKVFVIVTAQHRDLLDQTLQEFDIQVDVDLDLMRPNQDLIELNARLLLALKDIFEKAVPDAVLAQGDTTTVFSSALACFYKKIPFGHVEAGLRTGNFQSPFPEEMNRVFTSKISKWHFAPTLHAKNNLISEGVSPQDIYVVGNSVIDSLLMKSKNKKSLDNIILDSEKKLILVTVHRRENFGEPLVSICKALNEIIERNANTQILISVHPNPNTKNIIENLCGNTPRIILSNPLGYSEFVSAMNLAHIILSDSGGIQEEAPSLGKPVLVLRNETERPEALASGAIKLIGVNKETIVREVNRLLDDERHYSEMAKISHPYGDGNTSKAVVEILTDYFF